jgi:prefoldin subunit 5
MGRGRFYGVGYGWYPAPVGQVYPVDAAEEMDMLKAEADYIKKSLEAVNKRIEELEKKPSKKS